MSDKKSESLLSRLQSPIVASILTGCCVSCAFIYYAKKNTPKIADSSSHSSKRKEEKQVRIYMDGCWDMMHSGHYNAMRQARNLGTRLVVGVHSDEEITANKRLPLWNNEERVFMVGSCKWADEVIFDVPYSPTMELLDRNDIRADWIAHGDDVPIDAHGNPAFGAVDAKFKIFKRTPGISTTSIIERLLLALADTKINESESEIQMHERALKAFSLSQFLSTSSRFAKFTNLPFNGGRQPSKTDKVVFIDGDFDLYHCGHVAALRAAKEMGTFLYVGVLSDSVVRQARDSPHWPMMCTQERALNVLSCKYVDDVVVGSPIVIGADMITALNISVVVVATHIALHSEQLKGRHAVAKERGIYKEITLTDKIGGMTTDKMIDRMVKRHSSLVKQNEKRVSKEMDYVSQREYVVET